MGENSIGFDNNIGKFAGLPFIIGELETPKVISFFVENAGSEFSRLTIIFTSKSAKLYAIESSRDLVNWNTLTVIEGEENNTKYTMEKPSNEREDIFYRITKQG